MPGSTWSIWAWSRAATRAFETLHKQITVAQNEAAVATMKELGILFDFGFMMLDPRELSNRYGQRRFPSQDRRGRIGGSRVLPNGSV